MDTTVKMVILASGKVSAVYMKAERVEQTLREMSIWDAVDKINNGPVLEIRYVIYV